MRFAAAGRFLSTRHPQLPRIRVFSHSAPRRTQWGFIGLGAMGFPMAQNLRARTPPSDSLLVYDSNAAATERFVLGDKDRITKIAASAREVAEKSDTIITVLPAPEHVTAVFGDILLSPLCPVPSGVARLFIDCSTIDPTTSRAVASDVKSSPATPGASFVDAPMSGGVVGAQGGTLTFMVGCEDAILSRVEAALSYMGKQVWHLGHQGSGLCGKLANNYALAIHNIAAAEAMNLGISSGLDPKALWMLINSSTGRSWPSEVNNPVPGVVEASPASRGYRGGFGVSLMKKDLKLAIRAAEDAGARLELAAMAEHLYEKVEQEHWGKDFSVVYEWLMKRNR